MIPATAFVASLLLGASTSFLVFALWGWLYAVPQKGPFFILTYIGISLILSIMSVLIT